MALQPPAEMVPVSLKRAALRLVAESIVDGFLSKVGEHLGDAVGNVLGRKIDPDHGKLVPLPEEGADVKADA